MPRTHHPTTPSDEEIDTKLRALLASLEGPPYAYTRPQRAIRRRRLVLAAAGVGVCVAAAVAGITLAGHSKTASHRGTSGAACAAQVEFQGATYYGNRVNLTPLVRAGELGRAVVPSCSDVDGGSSGQTEATQVTVDGIAGVRPSVALAVRGQPDIVYLAAGRCIGFSDGAELDQCLHESLRFGGRSYTATRLQAPIAAGGTIGRGELTRRDKGTEPTDVRRLEGVGATAAVAVPGRPDRIYLADGVCRLAAIDRLRSCLLGES